GGGRAGGGSPASLQGAPPHPLSFSCRPAPHRRWRRVPRGGVTCRGPLAEAVPDVRARGRRREAAAVVRHSDVDDPQLPLHDVLQQRDERIRPLVLLQERTARQRAQETDTPPATPRALPRRFDTPRTMRLL